MFCTALSTVLSTSTVVPRCSEQCHAARRSQAILFVMGDNITHQLLDPILADPPKRIACSDPKLRLEDMIKPAAQRGRKEMDMIERGTGGLLTSTRLSTADIDTCKPPHVRYHSFCFVMQSYQIRNSAVVLKRAFRHLPAIGMRARHVQIGATDRMCP